MRNGSDQCLVALGLGVGKGAKARGLSLAFIFLFLSHFLLAQYPEDTTYKKIEAPADALSPGYLLTYDNPTTQTRVKQITQEGDVRHSYPKRQPWNSDGTKYKIGTSKVYNADDNAVYISLSGLDIYESVWSHVNPSLIYGFTVEGKIRRYNVDTGRRDLVYDFNEGSALYKAVRLGPGEGNIDKHDKYVALVCESMDSMDMTIVVFDLQLEKIVTTKKFEKAWDNGGWSPKQIDWVSVSQSGDYVGIMWNHSTTSDQTPFFDQDGNPHYGVEMYKTTDLSYLRRIVEYGNHGDFGYAPDGREVLVQGYGQTYREDGKRGSIYAYYLIGVQEFPPIPGHKPS